MVQEADLLSGETKGCPESNRGATTSRPIRKKGYHRALKRKEMWALLFEAQKLMAESILNTIIADKNVPENQIYLIQGLRETINEPQNSSIKR